MVTSFASGSISTTTAEKVVFDVTADEFFTTWMFAHNMQSGDTVIIRVYVKDQDSAVMRIASSHTLTGVQDPPGLFIPFVPSKQYKVTIQRTGGSQRTYTWLRSETTQ